MQAGDCTNALVAAAILVLSPSVTLMYTTAGMLSVDGRCKTFDERANGYVRADGLGALLIDVGGFVGTGAEANGEEGGGACAVLSGSAVRHEGKSASLTAPNGSAQATLLRVVVARAALLHVSAVETHGSGTKLGDPTEAKSLERALGAYQAPEATRRHTDLRPASRHLRPDLPLRRPLMGGASLRLHTARSLPCSGGALRFQVQRGARGARRRDGGPPAFDRAPSLLPFASERAAARAQPLRACRAARQRFDVSTGQLRHVSAL